LAIEALRLERLNAYYGESHVLHDVSFALPDGQLLALLGRNGAGKSTCISAIVGLVPPRGGRVCVFGKDVAGLPPEAIAHAGVGLVPQGRRMFGSLTVRENLIVARKGSGQWDLARVLALFPRLGERQRQLASSLSGGEQQMLAIGRALMGNPRLLLLDEPSEGLAPMIVAEVGRIIADLRRQGLAIVLVEQNAELAMGLADRVVVLTTGRCVFDGDIAQARENQEELSRNLGVFTVKGGAA
jgi:branched-chain amino acid transport system ATP-binding protein